MFTNPMTKYFITKKYMYVYILKFEYKMYLKGLCYWFSEKVTDMISSIKDIYTPIQPRSNL